MVGITYPHWIGTSQKEVEIKATHNPYKAGSLEGVFSSYICYNSVMVTHLMYKLGVEVRFLK